MSSKAVYTEIKNIFTEFEKITEPDEDVANLISSFIDLLRNYFTIVISKQKAHDSLKKDRAMDRLSNISANMLKIFSRFGVDKIEYDEKMKQDLLSIGSMFLQKTVPVKYLSCIEKGLFFMLSMEVTNFDPSTHNVFNDILPNTDKPQITILFKYMMGIDHIQFTRWLLHLMSCLMSDVSSAIEGDFIMQFLADAVAANYSLCENEDATNFLLSFLSRNTKNADVPLMITCFQNYLKEQITRAYPVHYAILLLMKILKQVPTKEIKDLCFRYIWISVKNTPETINAITRSFTCFRIPQAYFFSLLFFYDCKILDDDLWQTVLGKYEGYRLEIAKQFAVFAACDIFVDFFEINQKKYRDISDNIGSTCLLSLSSAEKSFKNHLSLLFDRPWEFAQKMNFFNICNPNQDILDFKIDIPNKQKTTLSHEFVVKQFHTSRSILSGAFLKTMLSIIKIIPSFLPFNTSKYIHKYFLADILKSLNSLTLEYPNLLLEVLVELFNDPSLCSYIDTSVFKYYNHVCIYYAISKDEALREIAFHGLCNSLKFGFPGFQIIVPLFLEIAKIYFKKNSIEILNSFSSIICLSNQCTYSYSSLITLLKYKFSQNKDFFNKNIIKRLSSMKDNTVDIYGPLFDIITKHKDPNVYFILFQSLIELKLSGKPEDLNTSKTIITFILKNVEDIFKTCSANISILFDFSFLFSDFLPKFVKHLLKLDLNYTDLQFLIDLIILSQENCNYSSISRKIKKTLHKPGNENLLKKFILDYKRYPFYNGMHFESSYINPYSYSHKHPLSFVTESNVLYSAVNLPNKILLSNASEFGRSSVCISLLHQGHSRRRSSSMSNTIYGFHLPKYSNKFWPINDSLELNCFNNIQTTEEETESSIIQSSNQSQLPISISAVLNQTGLVENKETITPYPRIIPKEYEENCIDLYNKNTRNQESIGIVYVGKGQKSEDSILSNNIEDISSFFFDFLQQIGYLVDLKTHKGYLGPLDSETTKTSVYFANNSTEIMFNVVPLIGENLKQEEALNLRKTLISNNSVQIIWCEDDEKYKQLTLVSKLNHYHIVIYPYDDNHRIVQFFSKENFPYIPGLQGYSIVSNHSLAGFVRNTILCCQKFSKTIMKTQKENSFTFSQLHDVPMEMNNPIFVSSLIFKE